MRLSEHVDNFRRRVLEEALLSALPAFWMRRARDFDAAISRPGDFHGRATADEIAAHDARCAATALACRRHAWLVTEIGLSDDLREQLSNALDSLEREEAA